MKQLIINADDFGFTRDVNAGIVQAHREGVLTSTTLMANGASFDDAVRLARENPTLGIGCHLVLVGGTSLQTGRPLPKGPRQLLPQLATRQLDVYSELRPQIEKILDAGIRPTHLDTHKHTHLLPNVFRAVINLAREFGIPFVRLPLDRTLRPVELFEPFYRRLAERAGVALPDHFLGFRLTGSLTEQSLLRTLERLPEGLTELMCHPGLLGPELAHAETRLKQSRVLELEALISPAVKNRLAESAVRLRPFGTPG